MTRKIKIFKRRVIDQRDYPGIGLTNVYEEDQSWTDWVNEFASHYENVVIQYHRGHECVVALDRIVVTFDKDPKP